MPTDRTQTLPKWDVPLRRYFKSQGESSREILSFVNKRVVANDDSTKLPQNDICDRLYKDFFNRRQKQASLQEQKKKAEEEKHSAMVQRRFTGDLSKMAEKQRLYHQRMKEEHLTLGEFLKTLRGLEAERSALQNMCPLRLYPPMDHRSPEQEALFLELAELGDYRRNEVAINSLLVPNSHQVIRDFIVEAKKCKEQQTCILSEFHECNYHDESIDDILCSQVIEALENELELEENNVLKPEGSMEEPTKAQVESAAQRLLEAGFLEDLKHKKRELLVEMNILRLSMLHQLVRLDIDWKGLLAKVRLSKFHVRGYDSNEIENVKDTEWYRDLGSSTSLRNAMKIRNASNQIFSKAIDILINKKERPLIPEAVLQRHVNSRSEVDRPTDYTEELLNTPFIGRDAEDTEPYVLNRTVNV